MNKRLIAGILVVLILISIGVTVGVTEYKKSTTSSVQTQSVAAPAPVINLPVATVTDNSVSSAAALANIVAADTSSSSAALAAVSSPLSKYVVWPGYDTVGFDMSNVPAGSAEDCASACTGTPGCQWFSWGSDVNTCWMKKGNSYLTDLLVYDPAGQLDASHVIKGTDIPVFDISSGPQPDEQSCWNYCASTPGCQFAEFLNGSCWAKGGNPSANRTIGFQLA